MIINEIKLRLSYYNFFVEFSLVIMSSIFSLFALDISFLLAKCYRQQIRCVRNVSMRRPSFQKLPSKACQEKEVQSLLLLDPYGFQIALQSLAVELHSNHLSSPKRDL